MSIKATQWAYAQTVSRSSAKFLLVTLAGFVKYKDDDFETWSPIDHLVKKTEMDRKTVIRGIKLLLERGFIVPTGRYVGRFKNCPIYRLTVKAKIEFQLESVELEHLDLELAANDDYFSQESAAEQKTLPPTQIKPVLKKKTAAPTRQHKPHAQRNRVSQHTAPSQTTLQEGSDKPAESRLPESWVLPEAWKNWAQRMRPTWLADEIAAIAAIFHAHYRSAIGDKGLSADWYASWRLWVLRETHPARISAGTSTGNNRQDQYHNHLNQSARKLGIGPALPGESTAAFQARIESARHSQKNARHRPYQ